MTLNKGSEKLQIAFRYAFGLFSPVVISLAMVYAALAVSDYQNDRQKQFQRQIWEEKAEITLASVRSNLTFADQFTRFGNSLSTDIQKSGPASFSGLLLKQAIQRHYPGDTLTEDCQQWAFTVANGQSKAVAAVGFEKTRLRIMEKLFNALLEFSNNPEITSSQINQNEKFVKSLLGQHSAPLQLGRLREGRLTPVQFESSNCYIYWRQFKADDRTFGGWLTIIPASRAVNLNMALRSIATRTLNETRRYLAVAFVPCVGMENRLQIILPEQFDTDPDYRKSVTTMLAKLGKLYQQTPEANSAAQNQARPSKIIEIDNHLFVRDFTTVDISYDAVVFAPIPRTLKSGKTSPWPAMTATMAIWLIIFAFYYFKNGRAGLPLAVAFRVLFLFSGLLPIFLMLALAHGLIEDSYATSLIELRQENTERLARISEKSDNLLHLFGDNVSRAINDLNLQPLLKTNRREDAETAFNLARNYLEKIELALDYAYVFVPGGMSELFLHDQRRYKNAKTVMDLFGPSIYQINQKYSVLWDLPEINLDASQKNFLKILGGFHSSFLDDVFMYSYEKEIAIKFGYNSSDYFYTVALSDKGRVRSYVGFAANSEELFRKFLARELDSLNISDTTIFLAAEELNNSEFTIFPFKKMNVLNSQVGKNAMSFIARCRSSLFEKYMSDRDYMYVFYPMAKMQKYATGCVVSLAGINRERSFKRLSVSFIAVVLACIMYVLASFATSHMLKPVTEINNALQRISAGNLENRLCFARTDEIGQLGDTINMMLDGFKRRLRLGKFVSTTFEQSLIDNTSIEDSKRAKAMSGTVLFSDIRSFTTLSESNPPEKIAAMLNLHLETMSGMVQKFGGQVEQFIGDAVVAFFPDLPEKDCRINAVKAAKAMYKAHQEISQTRLAAGQFAYAFGIGLEHGQIIAGALITPSRSEFCIIGKTKADAEHNEQQSKLGRHTRIIVSAAMVDAASSLGLATEQLMNTGLFEITTGDRLS